jgi:hypothetical protein
MTKPEDIPQDVWNSACQIANAVCGCAPGRSRANGTSHSDSCWEHAQVIARAVMDFKAEEREACAAQLEDLNIDYRDRFEAAAAIRNRDATPFIPERSARRE